MFFHLIICLIYINLPVYLQRRLVLDKTEVVIHSDDLYAPVGLLKILVCHTEEKPVPSFHDDEDLYGLPKGLRLGTIKKISSGMYIRIYACRGLCSSIKRLSPSFHTRNPGFRPSLVNTQGLRIGGYHPRPRVRPLPHIWCQGHQLNVSGLSSPGAGSSASQQTTACLEHLHLALQAHGIGLDDVAYIHLYLR